VTGLWPAHPGGQDRADIGGFPAPERDRALQRRQEDVSAVRGSQGERATNPGTWTEPAQAPVLPSMKQIAAERWMVPTTDSRI
jgi:hypothetical protein